MASMPENRTVVLITGATGGIGTAVTETMHSAGWSVGLLDLDRTALETLSDKLHAQRPGSATFLAGDASSESDVQAWIDQTTARYDTIAGLVNVAGLWRSTNF